MNRSTATRDNSIIINALTIDLEDYFQVSAFENVVKRENWDKYESRIERNTYRLLEVLEESGKAHSAERMSSEGTCCALGLMPCANGSSCPSCLTPDSSLLTPFSASYLPQTSNLQPEALDASPLAPCASRLTPSIKATFFVLAWNAERHPGLIREMHNQGHEIACHGYDHRLAYDMNPEQFREDIRNSKKILEDIIGDEVNGYRAPSYSITKRSLWAFEILAEEGYRYDSSIFPIRHDRYGVPDAPRFPFLIDLNGGGSVEFVPLSEFEPQAPCSMLYTKKPFNLKPPSSNYLVEFPLSTVRICGQNIPVSGGGYFRLFPYSLVRAGLRRIHQKEGRSFIFYLHPWELDPNQPHLNNGRGFARFRHYVNLQKTEKRFEKLLADFLFSPIKDLLKTKTSNS
jgi:polysaccharide deacetylase family protein (PEP-CTERM system associated)